MNGHSEAFIRSLNQFLDFLFLFFDVYFLVFTSLQTGLVLPTFFDGFSNACGMHRLIAKSNSAFKYGRSHQSNCRPQSANLLHSCLLNCLLVIRLNLFSRCDMVGLGVTTPSDGVSKTTNFESNSGNGSGSSRNSEKSENMRTTR